MRRSVTDEPRRITLLTDFGTADGYAAAMRGVIAGIAPHAIVEDASHDIAPGDVQAAAFVLARYAWRYPPGTVHLIVVDPGVGTARRALAAGIDDRFFVAPDNGVLTRVLAVGGTADAAAERSVARATLVEITAAELRLPETSATFHGRDIFAPAAAHLAAGVPLDRFGPRVSDPVLLVIPRAVRDGGEVRGVVVHIDHFGNLITNIPRAWIDAGAPAADRHVMIDGRDVGAVRRTYGDVAAGEVVALIGSDGLLEIGVRGGSAADVLDAGLGAKVLVRHVLQQDS